MHGNNDVEAVITSCNQRDMITQAVQSLCGQTIRPKRIVIVDDGSTDQRSIQVLDAIEADRSKTVPIKMIRQPNAGVSAARNAGIRETQTPFVLVLDGDDYLESSFIEEAVRMLSEHPDMTAASSWLQTFGVLAAAMPGHFFRIIARLHPMYFGGRRGNYAAVMMKPCAAGLKTGSSF